MRVLDLQLRHRLAIATLAAWAATRACADAEALAPAAEPGGAGIPPEVARSVVRIEKRDGSVIASGLLVSTDGYLITKSSEVPRLEECRFRMADGTVVKVRETRREAALDLLLAQCVGWKDALAAHWAESRSIALGQWLLAPGQEGDACFGVMSAKRRKIGGEGAAIGVFMDEARNLRGVRILDVGAESPAATAGLRRDDVLVAVAGEVVEARDRVREVISRFQPGEEVEVRYRRGGKESQCIVRLASRSKISSNFTGEDYANGGVSFRTDNFPEVIQHDIPLSPADMGGPLLNLLGQVVGVNIARVDRVTTFALPMEICWPEIRKWIEADRHPPKAEPAARK